MGKRIKEWRKELFEHKNLIIISIIFLVIAMYLNYAAGSYAERKGAGNLPDLILDNVPTMDLDFIYVYGSLFIVAIIGIYALFFNVKELHTVIGQFSLLLLVRSFFMTLTHMSIPANALVFSAPEFFSLLDFKNALFFSGHTAVPFLAYLLFRKDKIGPFFLVATFVMAVTVLLMHVHYSIDVFAAFFITYGSYKIGNELFSLVNHYHHNRK